MASARAEARRKAILARGNDRLAKLTTSARGEDHPVYSHVDPPIPNVTDDRRTFLAEESFIHLPRQSSQSNTSSTSSESRTPSVGLSDTQSNPTEEFHQQFMQALMSGTTPPRFPPFSENPSDQYKVMGDSGDPFAALQFPQGQPGQPSSLSPTPKSPPTLLQKLLPIWHFLCVWVLLAYFVVWKEPEVFGVRMFGPPASEGRWRRWAELARGTTTKGWGVQVVPLFWSFMALEIALHSLRILLGFDVIAPSFSVNLILPHLPPPFPSLIINGLKYIQMGGVFLDDLAALLFGLGVCVVVGGMLDR